MDSEKRTFELKELRTISSATAKPNEKIIVGHAAVFDQQTVIENSFYEVIERGAFDGTIFDDVPLLVNHDFNQLPLARTGSGTLILSIDDVGLAIRAKLDVESNQNAKALYSAVERGDVHGMSFCFTIAGDEWYETDTEKPLRRITKIGRVFEVSAVNWPAYEGTDVTVSDRTKKSFEAAKRNLASYKAELARLKKANEELGKMKFSTDYDWKGAGEEFKSNCGFNKYIESPFTVFNERAVTVGNMPRTVVVPSVASKTINPAFNEVSTLVDAVGHLLLHGGETFSQPFLTAIGQGDYTDERNLAVESEVAFGYAEIGKTKVTSYCELSEELLKLPAADYAGVVFEGVGTSIRKFLSSEVLYGIGNDGQHYNITGIFSPRATAIDPATDIELSAITDTTLDDILANYGGDQDVDTGQNSLILSKEDLLAFSKVRTSVRSKFYEVKFDSVNTGTISGVRFVINSACKPISLSPDKGGAQSGDYVMAFGNPRNYLLVEFDPLKTRRSDDYHFRRGLSSFLATAYVGGNVVRRNGFLRCKRK